MHFEPLDVFEKRCVICQERRDYNQRAQLRRHTLGQFKTRQACRSQSPANGAIDERGRQLAGWEQRQCQKRAEQRHGKPQARQGPAGQRKQGEGGGGYGQTADPEAAGQSPETQPGWRAKADGLFKRRPSAPQQVITRIALPVRVYTRINLSGCRQRRLGDIELGKPRTARQMFDGAAIEIARGKIHAGEAICLAQLCIDQADAFEQVCPVYVGNQPHAGDDIAHRDIGCALALLGVLHHCLDGGALPGKTGFEPAMGRGGARIMVAQSLGQLRRKQLIQGLVRHARHCCFTAGGEQQVGECVALGARLASGGNLVRQPAQIFHQHDAQSDRHSP